MPARRRVFLYRAAFTASDMARKHGGDFIRNHSAGRQDDGRTAMLHFPGSSGMVTTPPASLYDKASGRVIPRLQVQIEESAAAPAGQVRGIDRG